MAILICPYRSNFPHISNETVFLSNYSCVHWSRTFNFLQELFRNLANWPKRSSFWPILAVNMPLSLSLIISSFWLSMRDVQLFLSFEYLETLVGLFVGLISILFCLRESRCLRREREWLGYGQCMEQSEYTQYLSIKFAILYRQFGLWSSKAIIITSKITDYRSMKKNIIKIKFQILWGLPK